MYSTDIVQYTMNLWLWIRWIWSFRPVNRSLKRSKISTLNICDCVELLLEPFFVWSTHCSLYELGIPACSNSQKLQNRHSPTWSQSSNCIIQIMIYWKLLCQQIRQCCTVLQYIRQNSTVLWHSQVSQLYKCTNIFMSIWTKLFSHNIRNTDTTLSEIYYWNICIYAWGKAHWHFSSSSIRISLYLRHSFKETYREKLMSIKVFIITLFCGMLGWIDMLIGRTILTSVDQ